MANRAGLNDEYAFSLAAAQTDGPGMAMFPPESPSLTFDLRRVQQLGLRAPGRIPKAPELNRNIDIGGQAYNAWSPVRTIHKIHSVAPCVMQNPLAFYHTPVRLMRFCHLGFSPCNKMHRRLLSDSY